MEAAGSIDIKLIPLFDGSPGQSVVAWLENVELICKMRKIEDITNVVPLRLARDALAVYLQLPNDVKEDAEKLKSSLLAAFSLDPFAAYEQFTARKLRANELPDVYLADLRRLAALFGGVPEKEMICAFVTGLPDSVRQLLRAGAQMEDLSLEQLVVRTRAVMSDDRPCIASEACLDAQEPRAASQSGFSELRCYACGGPNHFAKDCLSQRKGPGEQNVKRKLAGRRRNQGRGRPCAMASEAQGNLAGEGTSWRKENISLLVWNGKEFHCKGTGIVRLQLDGGGPTEVEVIVTGVKPLGFEFILGMNGIAALGGVTVDRYRVVRFGPLSPAACAAVQTKLRIDERGFTASYDPSTRSWTAAWKWSGGSEPGVLQNTIEEYAPAEGASSSYEQELQARIENEWLVPYDEEKYGTAKGLIPLMAVVQRNKKKVRPVLDFRELNGYIETFTADSDVCAQKLREWRRQGSNLSIIDLKNAYLQIRVDQSLWPYQTVVSRWRRYCLTRLGSGLNVAPLIMKAILSRVLSQEAEVKKGTSAYIDDILVNEDVISASRVEEHLARYGLICKPHERVAHGARVLGLRVWEERGCLWWKRDNQVPDAPDRLTRRSDFSHCGKLVSHFPICGWLRIATAFIKRRINDAAAGWDELKDDEELKMLLLEVTTAVKARDPAQGRWDVSGDAAKVWVDASSLAIGVVLEVNGFVAEDAAWLRPDDACHINMAELDAVIKGLNLAMSWQIRKIESMTDSVTVHRWISDGLSGRTRLKTKAAGEMLIRRRIGVVLSLVEEYGLDLTVTLVKSADNKADALTRVPQRWCMPHGALAFEYAAPGRLEQLAAKVHHDAGHPGIKRTLYFAKQVCPTASKRQIQRIVANCEACESVDPAPAKWKRGRLDVECVWQRLAMDIAHYAGKPYLTLVDCAPSRFAIWRPLRLQTSSHVVEQLESVFYERGAPEELLTDNDTAFRSKSFARLADRWNVRVRFRCAHAPAGNGIVERNHRTVKVIAARKRSSIAEAVYLCNITPHDDCTVQTAPVSKVYRYPVRFRSMEMPTPTRSNGHGPYAIGDAVWVKPPGNRCDRQYKTTAVNPVWNHLYHAKNHLSKLVLMVKTEEYKRKNRAELSKHTSFVVSAKKVLVG